MAIGGGAAAFTLTAVRVVGAACLTINRDDFNRLIDVRMEMPTTANLRTAFSAFRFEILQT